MKSGWVRAIGALKLCKGMMLLAISVSALKLVHHDVAQTLERLASEVHSGLATRVLDRAIAKASGMNDARLEKVSIAAFLYGAIFSTEGVGLLRDAHWAHWLAIVVTGSFLPFEAYEIVHKFSWMRVLVLVVNVAIVIYLVHRVRSEPRHSYA